MEHCSQHSFSFVGEVKNHSITGKSMASYDVEGLFTHVRLNETKSYTIDLIIDSHSNYKFSQSDHTKLFTLARFMTHFMLIGKY